MSKTVTEHFADCMEVATVIDNANALLSKTKRELESVRTVLESLAEYQHPKVSMATPYHLRRNSGSAEDISPSKLIDAQIQRINALLGDRA